MLLRSVHLDLDGRRLVLAQQVLHGVHVVLAHVGKTAAVVVPIAAEGAVHAVFVVGFVGRRSEPHVVIQLGGNRFRSEVFPAHPEELPRESGGARNGHLERPAQQAAVDQLLERLDRRAETIEGILEAEPSVQAEDAVVAPDGFGYALAFADGARHRFLAPDVLAGLGRLDGHDAVPVRRRGDMHDVDIGVGNQAAEVAVGFQRLAELLLSQRNGAFEVFAVHVADCHQPAVLVAGEVVAALADAAHADDAFGELVARSGELRAAEHLARDDRQQRHAAQRFQKISTGGTHVYRNVSSL
ncbi:unknown [Alistipes finegoldii CAG:68]|nr:unknown [Alistipes finegoldii CAG:68]